MFKGNPSLAVGIFVSVALLALASFAMWLAGTKGNEPMAQYALLFERDISGLSLGGPVYFMGVSVGQVSSMELVPGNPVKVKVDILILADTPIDQGTYASLVAQGITGVNVINIAAEPGEHAPLPEPENGELPTIPVRETGLSAMLAQAPVTVAKLNDVLDQLNLLLGPENRESIAASLEHIESLMEAVAADREAWAALPAELKKLLGDANRLVNELDAAVATLQPELSATLAATRQTAVNTEQLTARLDRLLSDNESEIEHFIDNGLGQAPEMIHELRGSLRELQKLLRQLQQDPSQLIHRPPNDALEVNP
jgi:phospholipid/cholesterol/gamma-HCH transport system substrate-binding protein